jgi:hypothetical protein
MPNIEIHGVTVEDLPRVLKRIEGLVSSLPFVADIVTTFANTTVRDAFGAKSSQHLRVGIVELESMAVLKAALQPMCDEANVHHRFGIEFVPILEFVPPSA